MEQCWNRFSPGQKFTWNALLGAFAVAGAFWLPPSQATIPFIVVKVLIFLFGLGFIQFQRSRNINASVFRGLGIGLLWIFYGTFFILIASALGYIAIEVTKASIEAVETTNKKFGMNVWTPLMSVFLLVVVPVFTFKYFEDIAKKSLSDVRAFLNSFFVGAAPAFITSKAHFILFEFFLTILGFALAGALIFFSNYYTQFLV